jgi:hypothetical protein
VIIIIFYNCNVMVLCVVLCLNAERVLINGVSNGDALNGIDSSSLVEQASKLIQVRESLSIPSRSLN